MKSKKIAVGLCVLALLGALFQAGTAEESEAQLCLVATAYPLYDMAKSISGEYVEVLYMPEATAEDAQSADILFCMSQEQDSWAAEVEGARLLFAADGLDLLEGDGDFLTIPVNNMICASYLADILGEMDAEHNDLYQQNVAAYVEAMSDMDLRIREATAQLEGTKISCEDGSMTYFAREYGLELSDGEEEAIVLHTYIHPAEEDEEVPYLQLMERNLAALEAGI
ncbi:MAG TPA: zinc ABC transporter substrate-binding protein [Candidatus Ornithocaccomicrobium faecavium]|uniref:Zinc ABC transporter substrate-binding protein n=1 Tax=Candidatus Ornithocaccomicrobium faecavium TaxID=2840890 RepID=A0A9D1P7Q1_9FIRM|nr:zinc ABC transporter substrate-binding protein [Candidatus Ornithocaccomicrobium faecavium]